MKGLILAGLMTAFGLMGMAESAKALPVSVPCSVALTAQGEDVNPYEGACTVGIASDIVTVQFQDFTIVWRDQQESVLTPTTMGLFQRDRSGLVLSNAMTRINQGIACAAGTMNTRRREILSVCFSRTTYDGLSDLSQNAQ
jgi:hypothetical protein